MNCANRAPELCNQPTNNQRGEPDVIIFLFAVSSAIQKHNITNKRHAKKMTVSGGCHHIILNTGNETAC
jgi:hypothetical protein